MDILRAVQSLEDHFKPQKSIKFCYSEDEALDEPGVIYVIFTINEESKDPPLFQPRRN